MDNGKRRIFLIGIGMGTPETLTEEARDALRQADVIVGAARVADPFKMPGKPCVHEYRPRQIRRYLDEHPEFLNCAALFSGDVGFYSGAKKMAEFFEDYEVTMLPGISSVAYFAAKLGTTWEDARILSMHGRRANLIHAVVHNRKTFALLGKEPKTEICEKLRFYHLDDVTVHIGNRLSYPDESIITKKGGEIRPEDFGELAVILIENPSPQTQVFWRIRDEEWIRKEGPGGIPMTKEIVRTAVLAELSITRDAVLYDIGAGTGSISIQAAEIWEDIRIYAVERKHEGCELIRKNKQRFCADQVEVIEGTAPEALGELEPPTHVFIGGSGGNLKEILQCVKEKNPQAQVVLTAISLGTMRRVMEAVEEGLLRNLRILQLTAAQSAFGSAYMMKGQNPIYIVTEGRNEE